MENLRLLTRWLPALLLVALGTGCGTLSGGARHEWRAQKPRVADGKIAEWVPAPEFLAWRQANPEADGFSGGVLTVTLSGPFHTGAWSQHAGAIWQLPRGIPAGTPFALRFKARSVQGPPHLTVLRTWGGARPWETIGITPQWQTYEVTLEPQSDTDQVTFSLAPRKGRLQPYCAGTFELHGVELHAIRHGEGDK